MTGQQVLDFTDQIQPVAPPRSGARRMVILVVLLIVSIAAALAIWRVYFATPPVSRAS